MGKTVNDLMAEEMKLQPGDKVKVLRKFKDREMGFITVCTKDMEKMVGLVFPVDHVTRHNSVRINSWNWPHFCLEIVERKPVPPATMEPVKEDELKLVTEPDEQNKVLWGRYQHLCEQYDDLKTDYETLKEDYQELDQRINSFHQVTSF